MIKFMFWTGFLAFLWWAGILQFMLFFWAAILMWMGAFL